MLQVEAITSWLQAHARPELATLYHAGMEVQVTVAADEGTRVEGAYAGRRWHGWTDGKVTWRPFRIPWHAWREPVYDDVELEWSFETHVEGIGLTGWDWRARCSRWVGFDFDAIVSHASGLSEGELTELRQQVEAVPWVTVRSSTSGKGLHLYVHLDPPIETANHRQHAALARAILGLLETRCSYPLRAKVDACGHVLWIWHRRQAEDGLKTKQSGGPLTAVPSNWRTHEDVIARRRPRPTLPLDSDASALVEDAVAATRQVPLSVEHRQLLDWLTSQKLITTVWWWDADRHLLVAHTRDLEQAHRELKLRGVFQTLSQGTTAQNCFAFPLPEGGWVVRRYGHGVREAATWLQDASGWTRCYLNRLPTYFEAMNAAGGTENARGGFAFAHLEDLARGLGYLEIPLNVPAAYLDRGALIEPIRPISRNRYVVRIPRVPSDLGLEGWLNAKDKHWERVLRIYEPEESPLVALDCEIIRHVVSQQADAGWYLRSRGRWILEPKDNLRSALRSLKMSSNDVDHLLGQAVLRHWTLANRPFEVEYPGNREWNLTAAQLLEPSVGPTPTWNLILEHLGTELTEAVRADPWCRQHELRLGGDYLRCWIAALFQHPTEPLPYLALFGPELSGKSTLHEGLALLFKNERGYARADAALTSSGRFNAELAGAVLCAIEEVNLRHAKGAYERLKDWVTTPTLLIHEKRRTPYQLPNTTHWIQTMNDPGHCPILPGDTRVVLIRVNLPARPIPKRKLMAQLKAEGAAFLGQLLALELPPSPERLRIPAIATSDKADQALVNASALSRFLLECCFEVPGAITYLDDFSQRFIAWLEPQERPFWSRARVGRDLPSQFPRGRWGGGGKYAIGNLSFDENEAPGPRIVRPMGKERLVPLDGQDLGLDAARGTTGGAEEP